MNLEQLVSEGSFQLKNQGWGSGKPRSRVDYLLSYLRMSSGRALSQFGMIDRDIAKRYSACLDDNLVA